jgi:mRNA turnover protein 4
MRNTFLKDIRQDWKGSRILFGRTRVMQKALGRSPEEEHRENLHNLTDHMNGDVGLLLTDEAPEVVKDYFDSFVKSDFARAGLEAPLTFIIPEGIVYSRGGQIPAQDDIPLAHSLESNVRSLGMPTQLKNGKVVLSGDYTVCKEGQVLDGKQTRLLKQFGIACSEFKIVPVAYYDKEAANVVVVAH